MNRVAVLTPPGAGAIATVAVAGPMAWDMVRRRFRPVGGKLLPEVSVAGRFWFGSLGGDIADEVVIAAPSSEQRVEIHCHGGRRVVRWVVELFTSAGCPEVNGWSLSKPTDSYPWAFDTLESLSRALTLRTASILLDQHHGAFALAVADILATLDRGDPTSAAVSLGNLAQFAPLGRHLVSPWKVVVAGPPNVGKSSLINALAGYQRSVVSPVAGTTRDAVTAAVAFDGWPVELTDTAGLRDTADTLEAEGVSVARDRLAATDGIVWVLDGTASEPAWPDSETAAAIRVPASQWVVVVNKADQPLADWVHRSPDSSHIWVSAATGNGVAALAERIASQLVPDVPEPGAAVPFTPALADAVIEAHDALASGDISRARSLLAVVPLTDPAAKLL